jgi:hypothetical protein
VATRDLATNSKRAFNSADKIISFTDSALIKSYKTALVEIRAKLSGLYERFLTLEEPTKAQLTQFMRLSNVEREIVDIMRPYLSANEALIKDMSVLGVDTGFFNHGWAVDQAVGVNLGWGLIDDAAVRAVAGLGGDLGVLAGFMPAAEIAEHQKVLTKAFKNYDKDTVTWIAKDLQQGIIQGESVPQVVKRLKANSLTMSYNSATKIARTEILRATGLGNQIAYDDARDEGVEIQEVWDATLDDRTRPDHATADGTIRDNVTKMFSLR